MMDPDWAGTWQDGITRASKSSFCRGQNDRGWKARIEWFLKSDSLTKILEGDYDDPSSNSDDSATERSERIREEHTQAVLRKGRAEHAARIAGAEVSP